MLSILPVTALAPVEVIIKLFNWNTVWKLFLVFDTAEDVSGTVFNEDMTSLSSLDSPSINVPVAGVREYDVPANTICIKLASTVIRALSERIMTGSIGFSAREGYLQHRGSTLGAKLDGFKTRVSPVGTNEIGCLTNRMRFILVSCRHGVLGAS